LNNNYGHRNSQGLDFIDTIENGTHSAIFYEEPEYGHMMEYRYLKIGLLKGETCIYTTHEKDDVRSIENEMSDFGIDVDRFKKDHLLHVLHITDPRQDPEGLLQGIKNLEEELLSKSMSSVRIVSRFIRQVQNDEEKVANMFVERTVHAAFEKYNGSFMCPYPVDDIKSAIEGEWMQNHLRNHHAAIFVFKNGKGLALDLPK
jgi:hypothetical protein